MNGRSTILSFLHPTTIGLLTIPIALAMSGCDSGQNSEDTAGAPNASGAGKTGSGGANTAGGAGGGTSTAGGTNTGGAISNGGAFMPVGGSATVETVACQGGF